MCRYRTPKEPSLEFLFLYLNKNHDVFQLKYLPDVEPVFMFMSQFSHEVSAAISCNTNIQWVYDAAVGFYWSAYATKNTGVAVTKIKNMLEHVKLYFKKTNNTTENKKLVFKRGMGVLAPAVYSNTDKNPICVQMAAFYLLCGDRFIYSHRFATLILDQGLDFLNGKAMSVTLVLNNKPCERLSRYVFRPWLLRTYNLWDFTSAFEMVTISFLSSSDKLQFDFIKSIMESDTLPNGWDTYKHYPLYAEYYQSKTHCLRRFSRKVVCELISDKLPNRAELYIGNDDDLKNISEVEQKKHMINVKITQI